MFRHRQRKKIFLCFYCHTPSTIQIDRNAPLRKWYCKECEQTNHLDENGEIVDYVPPANISPAPPVRRGSPSVLTPLSLESPFCDTCISNQTLLMKNLALFLPPEDHPDYEAYAAALPAHKAELEVKYPQVCADCEERVRARLQRNNYLAKTSALGGFLKQRRREIKSVRWGVSTWFRAGIWCMRGTLWWITSILFLAWCILGYIRPESIGAVYKIPYFGGNEPFRIYLPPAVEKLVELLPRTWMRRVPRYIATISPFVVMWDYKWLQAQRSPGSQVQGLREYRELQVIVLITRCVAWGLTQWTSDAVLTMWASVFLGTISMIAIVLSLGILKVRLPPEIDLQDTLEDFSPQSSPIPPPRHVFQRIHPQSRPLPSLKSQIKDPLDISSLGISDRPLPPYKDTSTMDWTPSSQETTFSSQLPPYSRETSIFASGRGALPPAPGTTFPIPSAKKSAEVNWFKTSSTNVSASAPCESSEGERPQKNIELREQRLFAPQESTGLESLLGQALRLDDEPTLVRAIKAMKRSMARDERVRESYIKLAVSVCACIVVAFTKGSRAGVSIAYIFCGGVWCIVLKWYVWRFIAAVMATLFGCAVGLPVSGVTIPSHPFFVRLYNPRFQLYVHYMAVIVLVVILQQDMVSSVKLKLDQWRKSKEEEEQRKQKMKGLLHTPSKLAIEEMSVSANNTWKRIGEKEGHKSRSPFVM